MIEENIVYRKAGKSVEKTAEASRLRGPRKAPDVEIGGKRGAAEFKDKQRPYKIRHKPVRERNGKPEKRTSEKVKAVRADEIGAEVGSPAPEDIAFLYRLVALLIKGYLLNVEIAVKGKIALAHKHIRHEKNRRRGERYEKGGNILFFLGTKRGELR